MGMTGGEKRPGCIRKIKTAPKVRRMGNDWKRTQRQKGYSEGGKLRERGLLLTGQCLGGGGNGKKNQRGPAGQTKIWATRKRRKSLEVNYPRACYWPSNKRRNDKKNTFRGRSLPRCTGLQPKLWGVKIAFTKNVREGKTRTEEKKEHRGEGESFQTKGFLHQRKSDFGSVKKN